MKELIRDFFPPVLWRLLSRIANRPGIEFRGNYNTWEEAVAALNTKGYAEPNILSKTLESVKAVRDGKAVYERDSVLFDEIHYSWPLLVTLMLGGANSEETLKVLDFGGSLGSTFFQKRKFLGLLHKKVAYGVVEQPHYVVAGNEHIKTDGLFFFETICQFVKEKGTPDVVVLSGVLQNLDKPEAIIERITQTKAKYIVTDRTPYMLKGNKERICIQHVPGYIYQAKYPHRFFVEKQLLKQFTDQGYELLERFQALDGQNSYAQWLGHIFIRKSR